MRGKRTREASIAKFWSRVDKKSWGCWIWTGARHERGYGRIRWDGRIIGTHRLAWELESGRPAPDNMLVLHTCDEPRCVYHGHLYLGTARDNTRDRRDRERVPRGSPRSIEHARWWISHQAQAIRRAEARILLFKEWIERHPELDEGAG